MILKDFFLKKTRNKSKVYPHKFLLVDKFNQMIHM